MHRSVSHRSTKQWRSACLAGAAFGLTAIGGAMSVGAAPITFTTEGSFSSDSVLIDPTGSGDYAVDIGSSAYATTSSANGTPVSFEAGPTATTSGTYTTSTADGNLTLTFYDPNTTSATAHVASSGSYLSTPTTTPPTTPTLAEAEAAQANGQPAGTGDTNFGLIVEHGSYTSGTGSNSAAAGGNMLELTLGNLTIGNSYNLELFFVDGRNNVTLNAEIFDPSEVASPTSGLTTGAVPEGTVKVGQYSDGVNIGGYMIGTFVADGTTESFYDAYINYSTNAYSGGNIQGLVLENLGPTTSVPEPASLGLLAVGGAQLLRRRRRV